MSIAREEVLAIVERSPAAVAVHDKGAWLGLFTDAAHIEDPVGAPDVPKAGGVLGAFWDTFIARHQIRFEIKRDHVVGRDVMRDALIHTRINAHLNIVVPAYLLYQIDEDGRHVRRMAAHWNLRVLSLGALKLGPRAWAAMTILFGRMIGRMGPRWVLGYLASLWRSVGKKGIAAVEELARAASAGDAGGIGAVLAGDDAVIELGEARLAPKEFIEVLQGGRLTVEDPVAPGRFVACRYRIDGASTSEGLALFEFAAGGRRIGRARFFPA